MARQLPERIAAATVQRISTDFRAALNAAAKAHRKDLPADFPAIIQQPAVAVTREAQVLTDADIRRLIDAAQAVDAQDGWGGDLARLILVLAATGARFSQIARMAVADVQDNRVMVPVSRKGHGTKAAARIAVRVGEDVIAALRSAVSGRRGSDILLLRPYWTAGRGPKLVKGERRPWQLASVLSKTVGKGAGAGRARQDYCPLRPKAFIDSARPSRWPSRPPCRGPARYLNADDRKAL